MPARGEIWRADLEPTRGHEQAGIRPALIVSTDGFNRGRSRLVIAIPLTTVNKGIPSHIRVDPPDGGVTWPSFIKCEDVRSLARERLQDRWGRVEGATMAAVERWLRILLEL